jgi:hypothetical protein
MNHKLHAIYIKLHCECFHSYCNFQSDIQVSVVMMTALWALVLCSLVEVDKHFRGVYCLYHQDDFMALMMEAVCTSQMMVNFDETSQHYIPERCHLHTCYCKKLKSHNYQRCYCIRKNIQSPCRVLCVSFHRTLIHIQRAIYDLF